MSSTLFYRKDSGAHRWRNYVIAFVVLLLVSLGLLIAPPPQSANAKAGCEGFKVHGTARSTGGATLKSYVVGIFLHNQDHPIRHVNAGTKGGFSLCLVKGPKVRSYAANHSAAVTLDFVAHKAHTGFYVRTVYSPLGASKMTVPAKFRRAKTVAGATSSVLTAPAAGQPALGGPPVTGTIDIGAYTVHPAVMAIEATKYMVATSHIGTVSTKGIEASVNVNGEVFSSSGSMAIDTSHVFDWDKQLKVSGKQKHVARFVRADLSMQAQYVCYPGTLTPWWGLGVSAVECTSQSSGRMTGNLHLASKAYRICGAGSARLEFFTNKNTQSVHVGTGTVFTARLKGGVLASSLAVSTTYNANSGFTYRFNQTKKVHHFCLGGNGKYLSTSSQLYVSLLSGGGVGCSTSPCTADLRKQD